MIDCKEDNGLLVFSRGPNVVAKVRVLKGMLSGIVYTGIGEMPLMVMLSEGQDPRKTAEKVVAEMIAVNIPVQSFYEKAPAPNGNSVDSTTPSRPMGAEDQRRLELEEARRRVKV